MYNVYMIDNLGIVSGKIERLKELASPCELCPRKCRANRSKGELGFCGVSDKPLVNSVGPHFGEESVLVGKGGSGTIFFAGCNLGCVFCQNYYISHHRTGVETTVEQLAKFMLGLQKVGCANINLVTPTHAVAAIAEAIELAREKGLHLPIVYNSGGYDSAETLKIIEDLIDIYMPDMKYSDAIIAKELSLAADYPQINQEAVLEMHRQVGDLQVRNGAAIKGLLVRHLVLPQNQAGSFEIIDFLSDKVGKKTAINVMDQYRPRFKAGQFRQIDRKPTFHEIDSVKKYAVQKGLTIIN